MSASRHPESSTSLVPMETKRQRSLLLFAILGVGSLLLLIYNRVPFVTSFDEPVIVEPTQGSRRSLTNGSQPYICATIVGRIGNALFKYASLLGLSHTNNMTLVLRDLSVLPHILQRPPMEDEKFEALCQHARPVTETKCQSFDKSLTHLTGNDVYVTQNSCLFSWMYFEPIKRDLPELLAFKDTIISEARRIMGDLRRRWNTTLVGMHVRRDDHTGFMAYWSGHKPVTPDYLLRAMTYFRLRFGSVHFVVASDEREWCRQRLTQEVDDVTILRPHSGEIDMAVLSLTDHMIISVGTFGWWAGYLNPGVKTYMQDFVVPDSEFSRVFKSVSPTDYFYPGWIPL